jgi:predicted lactoylglutathione lyase
MSTNSNTKIFVNLPIKDLPKGRSFSANSASTSTPNLGACMVVSDHAYVMLLTHAKFKAFAPSAIADANKSTEALVALSCENRGQVDKLVSTAVAAGGRTYNKPQDYGFMYGHGFQDLDGHVWELFYMDPGHVKQG